MCTHILRTQRADFTLLFIQETWASSDFGVLGDPGTEKGHLVKTKLEGLVMKLKLQYFDHLMQTADSLQKTLMLGKTEGKRRRGRQRMRW